MKATAKHCTPLAPAERLLTLGTGGLEEIQPPWAAALDLWCPTQAGDLQMRPMRTLPLPPVAVTPSLGGCGSECQQGYLMDQLLQIAESLMVDDDTRLCSYPVLPETDETPVNGDRGARPAQLARGYLVASCSKCTIMCFYARAALRSSASTKATKRVPGVPNRL